MILGEEEDGTEQLYALFDHSQGFLFCPSAVICLKFVKLVLVVFATMEIN